ncbi:hypothetical protein Pyn_08857 [Prunus yedoensis var. nudiflora]|uniref:Uncharacterized protein n=1 Tax=Prunus yedoensis var. nudiflora TaxID=2094558 RepID=A0A314Z5Z1_PRUYE|nr:hypothetical protein Pyn_08857 [Prunus yedoensis var. nudiflora]
MRFDYHVHHSLHRGSVSWGPYLLAVTEGCWKIKLQFYGFKLASAASDVRCIADIAYKLTA